MGRIIGIDYGAKRIGLAIGEATTRIAMPWKIMDGQDDPERDAQNIMKLLRSEHEKADYFVVGLPRNMDGTEGPQAEISRKFGSCLAEASGAEVVYQDERLSSYTAEKKFQTPLREGMRLQRGQRKTSKKKKIKKPLDAVAAAVILESYLQREEK